MIPLEISPQEVPRRIAAGEPLVLIDVREPEEQAITRIPDETTLIILCHHGVRSLNVVHWLREQGVSKCQSMAGGIDAWSALVDPSVPRY